MIVSEHPWESQVLDGGSVDGAGVIGTRMGAQLENELGFPRCNSPWEPWEHFTLTDQNLQRAKHSVKKFIISSSLQQHWFIFVCFSLMFSKAKLSGRFDWAIQIHKDGKQSLLLAHHNPDMFFGITVNWIVIDIETPADQCS